MVYTAKPEFKERVSKLMGGKDDEKSFWEIIHTETPDSIRVNTLKINPEKLAERLEKKGWKIRQPFKEYPEILVIDTKFSFGELGKSKEHLLGYYYVQDISSMLPIIALKPKAGESLLDLCASPGSKTTQAAAMMNNAGLILANDGNLGRIRILNSNLERCGVTNAIVSRMDGAFLCQKILRKTKMRFDKILVDAPCSGEGTLRKSPRTLEIWNKKVIQNLAGVQKKLATEAFKILKIGGEMVYSTCTLSPEEDEEVIEFLKERFDLEIEAIKLPVKTRPGVRCWEEKCYTEGIDKAQRLYPQDNNTDGFFLCKIKKLSNRNCE
jgi:NOL1/NOP2/sun family putative RNA methylase